MRNSSWEGLYVVCSSLLVVVLGLWLASPFSAASDQAVGAGWCNAFGGECFSSSNKSCKGPSCPSGKVVCECVGIAGKGTCSKYPIDGCDYLGCSKEAECKCSANNSCFL